MVSLEEIKSQARVAHDEEDTLLARLVDAATRHVEQRTRRALITQTWRLSLDEFPCEAIYVPRPPLIAVSSIAYIDEEGDSQTLSSALYRVDAARHPGRITPAWGESWPVALAIVNAVTVTHTAGYGSSPSDVPEDLRHAVLLLASHWFDERGAVLVGSISKTIEFAVESLCEPYEVESYA